MPKRKRQKSLEGIENSFLSRKRSQNCCMLSRLSRMRGAKFKRVAFRIPENILLRNASRFLLTNNNHMLACDR